MGRHYCKMQYAKRIQFIYNLFLRSLIQELSQLTPYFFVSTVTLPAAKVFPIWERASKRSADMVLISYWAGYIIATLSNLRKYFEKLRGILRNLALNCEMSFENASAMWHCFELLIPSEGLLENHNGTEVLGEKRAKLFWSAELSSRLTKSLLWVTV